MPKQKIVIKYDICMPEKCNPDSGICSAVKVCTHHILTQEETYDSPMAFPADMCQGCGDCIPACPLDALLLTDT